MKNYLLLTAFILLLGSPGFSQKYAWAYTLHSPERSHVVTVKQDFSDNHYVATYAEEVDIPYQTYLEKRDSDQKLLWQKSIKGAAQIRDIEINAQNHAVVVGYFLDSIELDGQKLVSGGGYASGFIFESDENGVILWSKTWSPNDDDFRPVDLFISKDGSLYFTAELGGFSIGFCSFHKADAQGNIVKNEFNDNFNNRTYSHIIADQSGNIILSGTCGPDAAFDSIKVQEGTSSYYHFLAGYDSTFKAQWVTTRQYITFDHNNELGTDGKNYYWAFDEFNGDPDTVRILKLDENGQVLQSVNGPLAFSFFTAPYFSIDSAGYSTLAFNQFSGYYIYRYDPQFNIIWEDEIQTDYLDFGRGLTVSCYDSVFYLAGSYAADTIKVGDFELHNPNTGHNFPVDLFVTKWTSDKLISINGPVAATEEIALYPNPASGRVFVKTSEQMRDYTIYDMTGKVLIYSKMQAKQGDIDICRLNPGIYVLKLRDEMGHVYSRRISVVR